MRGRRLYQIFWQTRDEVRNLMQVNATMFMGLLAVYTVLLAHYSSEEHICCGLPQAGRSRAEIEGPTLDPSCC